MTATSRAAPRSRSNSPVDDTTHVSNAIDLQLLLRQSLTPSLAEVGTGEIIYVNDDIVVTGDGLLLGGDEGTTVARIEGCYTVQGDSTCVPVGPVDVPVAVSGFDRKAGAFAFAPTIAGIRPGSFDGQVSLVNQPAAGGPVASAQVDVAYDVTEPAVFSLSPGSASLGQYVNIDGGGFVGGDQGGVTLIELDGQFTQTGGDAVPVTLTLVPEWVEGGLVRYVLNEDDELGHAIDLRRVTGTFSGTVAPVVQYDADEVTGAATSFSFALAPVKQVVYLEFLPSYVESLRHFGLRALDQELRQRIAGIMQRDYRTINLEVRLERPTDFALYATVQLAGPDPNGLGLLGYDNTPGKDTGNKRLYDQIGGVNAVTQEDGSPGYGGVFVDSMFAFSKHPGGFARSVDGQATDAFDQIFDPFRSDRGGTPVTSVDLAGGPIPMLDSGDGCPSDGSRRDQIACAVWVLGSLVGTTLSHEVGHSLGLANPFGEGYHDSGDEPNRLMDSGGDRPFSERAQLFGDGPGRFCDSEYDYLRQNPADLGPGRSHAAADLLLIGSASLRAWSGRRPPRGTGGRTPRRCRRGWRDSWARHRGPGRPRARPGRPAAPERPSAPGRRRPSPQQAPEPQQARRGARPGEWAPDGDHSNGAGAGRGPRRPSRPRRRTWRRRRTEGSRGRRAGAGAAPLRGAAGPPGGRQTPAGYPRSHRDSLSEAWPPSYQSGGQPLEVAHRR